MSMIYNNKYNDPVKINDKALLKFNYTPQTMDFIKCPYSLLSGTGYHWIQVLGYEDESYIANLHSVVWDRGSSTYNHRLNWTFDQGVLFTPPSEYIQQDIRYISVDVYIPQLFSWTDVYGLLVCIQGCETKDVYFNEILRIDDFHLSKEKILKDQIFWLEYATIHIPDNNEEYFVECRVIKTSDINSESFITNYPTSLQPIIQSKPLPDYITTSCEVDTAGFLHITPRTLENKTLENSLKDYFGYSRDKQLSITIQHVITFSGVNLVTGELENNILRVSNEENNFNECVIGIDISQWIDPENEQQIFPVEIETEIKIDSKIMTRRVVVEVDFTTQVLNLLKSQTLPEEIHSTEIKEITQVNQTVINKPTEVKIVKIYQPVFVKYIIRDIEYSNTNITFENLTEPCYLETEDSSIETHITSDNVYYFSLSELTPPTQNVRYKLVMKENNTVIGDGFILV